MPTFTSTPVQVRRMAVIGDSYSAGTDNPKIWPSIVAQREHYRLFDAGVPGAAYSGNGPTFQQQIDAVVAFEPSVLLVLGGRNDSERVTQVPAAATTFYSTLKQKLPNTKIVIMGPIWDASTPSAGVEAVDKATQAAATAAGLTYHDVLNERWLNDPALIGPDGVHPNDAGHQQLADKISAIVEADGLGTTR
jgi:lysophospholipase L1-like esterase